MKPNAPRVPLAARADLDLVAFRGAVEPRSADELAERYEYRNGVFSAADLFAGRTFLERWTQLRAVLRRWQKGHHRRRPHYSPRRHRDAGVPGEEPGVCSAFGDVERKMIRTSSAEITVAATVASL